MPVMNHHPHTHYENANGVDKSVKKKSARFITIEGFTYRVNHANPISHVFRKKIQYNIKCNEPSACEYPQPPCVFHYIKKDSIVFYLGMKDAIPQGLGRSKVDGIIKEEMRHITTLSRELETLRHQPI